MKIKEGFLLREVAGNYVIIGAGDDAVDFKGVITVNELGAFIWHKLEENMSFDDIIKAILAEYDVDENTARNDAKEFLDTLKDNGIVVL